MIFPNGLESIMQLDVPLSWMTRRFSRVPGTSRILEPLRRWTVNTYAGKPERWITIKDFEGDLRFVIDRGAYMSSTIYWRGIHAFREASLVRRFMPRDGVFVDVGANQGEITLIAARQAPMGQIFAFEPMMQWYELLSKNVSINALNHVFTVNAALANHTGQLEMFTSTDVKLHHSFHEGLSSFYKDDYRSVPLGHVEVMKLDDFLETRNIKRLDLIKIDVEGAEKSVLDGASESLKRFRPGLILEFKEKMFSAAGYSGTELAAQLSALGYNLYEVNGLGSLRPLPLSGPFDLPCIYCRHDARL